MNKKFLTFGLLGLFAIVFVSAAAYYAVVTYTVSITQPISVTPETISQPIDCESGETCREDGITVTNGGDNSRDISITDNSGDYTNAIDSIRYVGILELSQKNTENWQETANKVTVEYTAIGSSFSAEVVEGIVGYELVYYADDTDSQTVAEREANPQPVIRLNEVSGNLPYTTDGNWQEDTDYSGTPDFYNQWKGAKLWYVPSSAINSDNTLVWSQWNTFYYETDLIQFNSNGEIVLFPGASLTLYPEVSINTYASTGDRTLEVTVA
jgi:hypothetical protein